jgi:gliding motility-associated-like protein
MKGVFFNLFLFLGFPMILAGQVPQIDNVEEILSYPNMSVQITGSGFSSTPAQLQVWFGNVKGNILSSSETFIDVQVPPQARVANLEVINLTSKRSGKYREMVVPIFSGVQPLGNFTGQTFASPANDIFDLCSCDFDLNGKTDIVGSKFRDGASNLMLMTNTGTVASDNATMGFSVSSIPLASIPTYSVTCGDLNGDGKPELVATRGGNTTGSNVYIFPNTSAGTISFGAPVPLDLISGDFGKEVAIRDLNKDGRSEIIVTNSQTNVIYIYENKLTTATIVANQFTRVDKMVTGNNATDGSVAGTLAMVVQDFTGDGWPEIVVTPSKSYTNQKTFILTNPANGSVNFTSISNFTVTGSANINDLASADFNSDGKLDLVYADRQSSKAFVFLNQGNLAFNSVNGSNGFASSDAWGVDVADMNGDGLVDFVVGSRNFTVPEINIFTSNGGSTPTFSETTISTTATKGNWFVKVGDYDGDSKPDIAVTATNNINNFSIDIWKNKTCHQPVIFNDDPLTICTGQTITLNAAPVPAVSFSWDKGTNTGNTSDITIADAGIITLTATGDGGACIATTSITINAGAGIPPFAPVITQPTVVCAGAEFKLESSSVAGATYIWSGPDDYSFSNSVNEAVVTTGATIEHKGNYFLRLKVGDCFSAESPAKFVDVIAPPAFAITGISDICAGQSLSLSVTSSTDYDYQWKKNGSDIAAETQSIFPKSSRNAAASDDGSYTVVASHKTYTTCIIETSPFVLDIFTAPVASLTFAPEPVCVGTQIMVDASGSAVDPSASLNYSWDFGDGETMPNETTSTTTHIYTAVQSSIDVSVTISYIGITACTSSSSTTSFDVSDATAPTIITIPEGTTDMCPDGTETISITVPETFTSYTWSTTQTTQTIDVTQPGIYSVETVNAGGCAGTAQFELLVRVGCGSGEDDLVVSKLFTPNNGDAFNDTWKILGIENLNADCEANIFDGRGRRVITLTQSDLLAGWRGTNRPSGGADLPAGTYFYVIGCPTGKPITGSVMIAR